MIEDLVDEEVIEDLVDESDEEVIEDLVEGWMKSTPFHYPLLVITIYQN